MSPMTRLASIKRRGTDAPEPRIQPMPDGTYWRAAVGIGAGSFVNWFIGRVIGALVTVVGISVILWGLEYIHVDSPVRYL